MMIVFMAFRMLVGMGSAVRISLALGEKDFNRANRIWEMHSFFHLFWDWY